MDNSRQYNWHLDRCNIPMRILQDDPRRTVIANDLGNPSNPDAVADATLMAAAPNLLDALRRVMRHIPADAGGCSLGDDMHRARQAIKKATGAP